MSGRSKPPYVLAAFSSAPYPGGYRTIHWPCSGLHPQGFVVPTYPVPQTLSELLARLPALLARKGSIASLLKTGRVVSVPLP